MKRKVEKCNPKTVPRVKVTLQGTKLYSSGEEIKDDLKIIHKLLFIIPRHSS